MADIEKFDLVVVGAGIHGLVIAKTYCDVHPEASILVLDKSRSIGGVWAKDRLYPGLHTNNHFRTFEVHVPLAVITRSGADSGIV